MSITSAQGYEMRITRKGDKIARSAPAILANGRTVLGG
jgi:hypothetical protein